MMSKRMSIEIDSYLKEYLDCNPEDELYHCPKCHHCCHPEDLIHKDFFDEVMTEHYTKAYCPNCRWSCEDEYYE